MLVVVESSEVPKEIVREMRGNLLIADMKNENPMSVIRG